MSAAHIVTMDDLESRIREHAFELWEAAGCPENRAEEFWARAEEVERNRSPLDPDNLKWNRPAIPS